MTPQGRHMAPQGCMALQGSHVAPQGKHMAPQGCMAPQGGHVTPQGRWQELSNQDSEILKYLYKWLWQLAFVRLVVIVQC